MQEHDLIFVVDDDSVLREQIVAYLTSHGYEARGFCDVSSAEAALERESCALLLLDIMLPEEDGLTFCRRLRASSSVPIIFLSALGELTDRVVGLELGADDYLVKPFSSRELLARIRTLLRRMEDLGAPPAPPAPAPRPVMAYRFAGWTMEPRTRLLIDPSGLAGNLSAAEFRLLRAFLEHPHEVLDRETLLEVIQRRGAEPFDRVLDVQISRLRSRLGENAREPRLIKTARGDGYLFTADVEKETE